MSSLTRASAKNGHSTETALLSVMETFKTAQAAVQSLGYLDATATNPFFQ